MTAGNPRWRRQRIAGLNQTLSLNQLTGFNELAGIDQGARLNQSQGLDQWGRLKGKLPTAGAKLETPEFRNSGIPES